MKIKLIIRPSFPWKRESSVLPIFWIPAFAGMTERGKVLSV
jgi:hypothetical protein